MHSRRCLRRGDSGADDATGARHTITAPWYSTTKEELPEKGASFAKIRCGKRQGHDVGDLCNERHVRRKGVGVGGGSGETTA